MKVSGDNSKGFRAGAEDLNRRVVSAGLIAKAGTLQQFRNRCVAHSGAERALFPPLPGRPARGESPRTAARYGGRSGGGVRDCEPLCELRWGRASGCIHQDELGVLERAHADHCLLVDRGAVTGVQGDPIGLDRALGRDEVAVPLFS